jgi:hypothetical protein
MTTAAPDQSVLVSQPSRERIYSSRRSDLQLIKTPRYPMRGPDGQKVGETQGITVQFQDGMLRLPLSGEVRTKHGTKVNVSELHEWLEDHYLFDDREEGFFVMPIEAPPISGEEMSAFMDAAMRLDAEMLEGALEQERAGWNRPAVLETLGFHLDRVRQLKEQEALLAQEKAAQAKK